MVSNSLRNSAGLGEHVNVTTILPLVSSWQTRNLLSNAHKVPPKVLTKMLEKTLDENQSRQQARFRSGYWTTDQIHFVNQLNEKCREYNITFCIAFVHCEKAFHSVQAQPVLTSLQEQGIEDECIELLKDIYTNRSMTVHPPKEGNKINIRRGVRKETPYRPSYLRQLR